MTFMAFALLLLPLLLVATVLVPDRRANESARRLRTVVLGLAACQFGLSAVIAPLVISGVMVVDPERSIALLPGFSLTPTILYDGPASLMLTLVSFVGWVICRYSVRYLDGEARQGSYFRWTAFTLGSVALMVLAGNLAMFFIAWVMTSTGLHHLLLYYRDRPAARRAAQIKFLVSRIGDLALLGAIALLYGQYRSLDMPTLFAKVADGAAAAELWTQIAAVLLVVGAITKSAQFPFHTWMPLTMETPTPVSALMHAGIVNAGGYLMIRVSPLVSLSTLGMNLLAVIGGFTACYAALVMVTQTSIKKKLAYSTIAQMGFMLLQCGLGAYSAAMLHILAHSLYKAYAFLSSGSVIAQAQATRDSLPLASRNPAVVMFGGGAAVAIWLTAVFWLFRIDPAGKPGGMLLGGVLWLSLTYWLGQVARTRRGLPVFLSSAAISAALCFIYVASFKVIDRIVAPAVPSPVAGGTVWIQVLLFAGFAGLFWMNLLLVRVARHRWAEALYVHLLNGFYIESRFRRLASTVLRT
jgi:NAD(P)H-quinone oxidoreductase subunit 5